MYFQTYLDKMFQLLVLIFAFMRKRAWDYGRLALVNKDYEKYDFIF